MGVRTSAGAQAKTATANTGRATAKPARVRADAAAMGTHMSARCVAWQSGVTGNAPACFTITHTAVTITMAAAITTTITTVTTMTQAEVAAAGLGVHRAVENTAAGSIGNRRPR